MSGDPRLTPNGQTEAVRSAALRDLLVRVEAAEGADRELDAALYVQFECIPNDGRVGRHGWTFKPEFSPYLRRDDDGEWSPTVAYDAAPYTASLDAALALVERVLPGWSWDLGADDDDAGRYHYAALWDARYRGGDEIRGKTPALALIAALLKALIASDADTGEQIS